MAISAYKKAKLLIYKITKGKKLYLCIIRSRKNLVKYIAKLEYRIQQLELNIKDTKCENRV